MKIMCFNLSVFTLTNETIQKISAAVKFRQAIAVQKKPVFAFNSFHEMTTLDVLWRPKVDLAIRRSNHV